MTALACAPDQQRAKAGATARVTLARRRIVRRDRERHPSATMVLVLSLSYAAALITIPWELLRGEPFWDLQVYLHGFDLGAYEYLDELEGPLYLLSEPVWRWVIGLLQGITGNFESAFKAVSFCVACTYCFVMLRARPAAAMYLYSPLLIDLLVSQVRSALAGALFFLATSRRRVAVWLVLLPIATLIHTSSLVLFGLYGGAALLVRLGRTRPRIAAAFSVCVSILLPLLFVATFALVLGEIGDRRAESEAAWPGGLFVATFSLYYLLLLANMRRVVREPNSVFAMLVTGFFLFTALFEVNSLRFIALTFPALVLAAFRLPVVDRHILLVALFAMTVYHVMLWLA